MGQLMRRGRLVCEVVGRRGLKGRVECDRGRDLRSQIDDFIQVLGLEGKNSLRVLSKRVVRPEENFGKIHLPVSEDRWEVGLWAWRLGRKADWKALGVAQTGLCSAAP